MSERGAQAPADQQFINRWSPRAFNGKPRSQEQVMTVVEAARWAPSCFNSQPWRFVYAVKDSAHWPAMLKLLMDMNQAWAQHAGALIAVVSRNTFEANNNPAPTHSFDTGAAWMSLALQARAMGLASHAMWGIEHDNIPKALNLPDNMQIQAIVAVGEPGDKSELPEPLQEREQPSPRKALEDIVFEGQMPDGVA
ncbi:MAG: nitroreductase family protein [Pseudomonadota bacterium]|nr:nitroreductase family protein [Pseudomonadota bacterium]